MRKPYIIAIRSNPTLQELSYSHEQLNSKSAMEREGRETEWLEGPWRCPHMQVGAWARKWRLLQFRKSCGPWGRKQPLPFALGQRARVSLLQKQWGARKAQRSPGAEYEHSSAVRSDIKPATAIRKRVTSQFLHKWCEHCALQTTSTSPVSEENKDILTAGSSQASTEVSPPTLTNAINSSIQGRSETPQGSTGKWIITLGPISFCSSQHHGRDEKNL